MLFKVIHSGGLPSQVERQDAPPIPSRGAISTDSLYGPSDAKSSPFQKHTYQTINKEKINSTQIIEWRHRQQNANR
jgi:hypothetical protein